MKTLSYKIFLPSLVMAVCLGGEILAEEGANSSAIKAIREEITLPSFESPAVVTGSKASDSNSPKAAAAASDEDLKKRLAELAEAEKTLEAKLSKGKSVAAPVSSSSSSDPMESAKAKLAVPVKKEEVKPASSSPKVSSVVSEVASLEASRAKLQRELASSQASVRKLASELDEMRSRLMIAETEVERLSALLEEKNASQLKSLNVPTKRRSISSDIHPLNQPSESVVQEKMTSDMPVATVIAEKAHLRTAPGEENSPLMTVSQGTRLAVETRQGSWLRVLTPTGSRAWISSSVVTFGRGKTPPKMANGFESEGNSGDDTSGGGAEDRAFKSLQSGLN